MTVHCPRGQPEEVRSHNGENFVCGERELREAIKGWNQHKIGEFLLQLNVTWTFNPPGGSHHGGVWECCIGTVRKVMSTLTKEQIVDDEGLAMSLCEVESIVNGRPVTKVSDDPRDMEVLTLNHFHRSTIHNRLQVTANFAVTWLKTFGTTWSLLQK